MTDFERPKVGYARVSSEDQSLQLQIDALKKYGVDEEMIYTDKITGATMKRPGLKRAFRMACMLKAEFVVWKFDRLGRSVLGVADAMKFLDENGVSIYSITDRVDISTAAGKFTFHVLIAAAEFERGLISERTKAGIASAKAAGKEVGRKNSMTEERAELAAQMVEDEMPVSKILEALKELDGPSIGRSKLYSWIAEYRDRVGFDDPTDDH